MSQYEVTIDGTIAIYVEANDEEDAKNIAQFQCGFTVVNADSVEVQEA